MRILFVFLCPANYFFCKKKPQMNRSNKKQDDLPKANGFRLFLLLFLFSSYHLFSQSNNLESISRNDSIQLDISKSVQSQEIVIVGEAFIIINQRKIKPEKEKSKKQIAATESKTNIIKEALKEKKEIQKPAKNLVSKPNAQIRINLTGDSSVLFRNDNSGFCALIIPSTSTGKGLFQKLFSFFSNDLFIYSNTLYYSNNHKRFSLTKVHSVRPPPFCFFSLS